MTPLTVSLLFVVAPFLLVSGIAKIVALDDARRTLSALRLPQRAPRATIGAACVLECALGVGLLTLDGQARIAAATASAVLLAGFTVITARAVACGATEECGCFGRWSRTPISGALVRRNSIFTLVALLTAVGSEAAASAGAPPAIGAVIEDPATGLFAIAVGGALIAAGAVAARANRRDRRPTSEFVNRRPALLRDDGLVVDVVTEAVRGRGQLLLFAQPGCARCERSAALLDDHHAELADLLDVRIVYAVGPGVEWNAPARAADGPRTRSALDLGGLLAQTLDVGAERPTAILIATSGRPVLPYAVGEREVGDLVAALVRART